MWTPWIYILLVLIFTRIESALNKALLSNVDVWVVIYAKQTFHEEVTFSISCLLHEMEYKVAIYIGEQYHIAGINFSSNRKRYSNSKNFYGSCISLWIDSMVSMPLPMESIKSVVYITHPMMSSKGKPDTSAFHFLNSILDHFSLSNHAPPSVILITHRSTKFWRQRIEHEFPNVQIYYLFLSEHTHLEAIKQCDMNKDCTISTNKINHLFPILPLQRLYGINNSHIKKSKDLEEISLVIQGRFGGRHQKRRDLQKTINCINSIQAKPITLDLVGIVINPFTFNTDKKKVGVRQFSGLQYSEFYGVIKTNDFLLPAVGDISYHSSRATSSIPVALSIGLPLVVNQSFLQLYPCLRDSPILRSYTKEDECDTLNNVVNFSSIKYIKAVEELEFCAEIFWENAKETMLKLIH